MVSWGGLSEDSRRQQSLHRERASNLTGTCLYDSQLGKPDVSHPRQGSGILPPGSGGKSVVIQTRTPAPRGSHCRVVTLHFCISLHSMLHCTVKLNSKLSLTQNVTTINWFTLAEPVLRALSDYGECFERTKHQEGGYMGKSPNKLP
jgi:hypothetical protein